MSMSIYANFRVKKFNEISLMIKVINHIIDLPIPESLLTVAVLIATIQYPFRLMVYASTEDVLTF